MAIEEMSDPMAIQAPAEEEPGFGEMTLMEHLRELRNRVFVSALAVILGMVLCLYFYEWILDFLTAPAPDVKNPDGTEGELRLASFSPLDRISVIFKIGLYGGLIMASPVVIYEIMAFILPGLTPREKRLVLPGLLGI